MKRYTMYATQDHYVDAEESPNGEWVHYEDLQARDQTIKDLGFQLGAAEQGLANATQEIEELRTALEAAVEDMGAYGIIKSNHPAAVVLLRFSKPQKDESPGG